MQKYCQFVQAELHTVLCCVWNQQSIPILRTPSLYLTGGHKAPFQSVSTLQFLHQMGLVVHWCSLTNSVIYTEGATETCGSRPWVVQTKFAQRCKFFNAKSPVVCRQITHVQILDISHGHWEMVLVNWGAVMPAFMPLITTDERCQFVWFQN